jgi:hypothetical protein
MTDTLILGAIGSILLVFTSIIGYLISIWMARTSSLISEASGAIAILNVTLTKVNLTMEVYQATVNEELKGVKERVSEHSKILSQHMSDLQDHEIRINISETKCDEKHQPKISKR